MRAQSIFLTTFITLLIFNIFLWLSDPGNTNFINDLIGGVIGLIASATTSVILGGLNIFGSGLSSASIRILFGVSVLLTLLFQLNIANIPVGLGLANNLLSALKNETFGFIISFLLTLSALVSGCIMLVHTSGD